MHLGWIVLAAIATFLGWLSLAKSRYVKVRICSDGPSWFKQRKENRP